MEDTKVYADWDALAHCEYPVPSSGPEQEADCREPAAYHIWWAYDDGTDAGEMRVCFRHWQYIMRTEETGDLDPLEQRAAENALGRLALFIDAIRIAAEAAEAGPGAKSSIASHLKYTTTTVSRLAAMHGLPDDCIDLELPLGTYWVALLHAADAPVEFLRQQAIPGRMSPAEAKRALGVEVIRESRLAELEAELERWRALVPEVELLERAAMDSLNIEDAEQLSALAARIKEAQKNDGA